MAFVLTIGAGVELAREAGLRIASAITSVIPGINSWLLLLLMIIGAIVVSQITAFILRLIANIATVRTKTIIDDIIISHIHQPLAWVIFSILLYVAVAPANFGPATTLIANLLLSLNIILLAILLHKGASAFFEVWDKVISRRTKSIIDDTILPILSKFTKAAIWIFATIGVISSWGVQVAPFLAGLGIAGIAVGFAVKDSLANIFAGIALAFDNAYRIGDKIRLADGTVGTVHDITLRSTRIQTYDGDLVMIPNGKIANDNVYTYAQPRKASRVKVAFGVEYGVDVERVKKYVLEAIKQIDDIKEEPKPSVVFENMGDFALEMKAYFWVDDYSKAYSKKIEAVKIIYDTLRKKRIGIPYPTQTIYLKK